VRAGEVYLKALNSETVYNETPELGEEAYRVTAKSERGHRLSVLFSGLDGGIQQRLESAYQSWRGRHKHPTLSAALQTYNATFVDSRYLFEEGKQQSGVSISALVALMNFLGEFVTNLLPAVHKPGTKGAGPADGTA
jgi:hypothetical protein